MLNFPVNPTPTWLHRYRLQFKVVFIFLEEFSFCTFSLPSTMDCRWNFCPFSGNRSIHIWKQHCVVLPRNAAFKCRASSRNVNRGSPLGFHPSKHCEPNTQIHSTLINGKKKLANLPKKTLLHKKILHRILGGKPSNAQRTRLCAGC